MKHDCVDELLIWHEEQTFVKDQFGSVTICGMAIKFNSINKMGIEESVMNIHHFGSSS